jgi:UDP-2,3-diacylglucosamine hydrolase
MDPERIPLTRVAVPEAPALFFSDAHLGGRGSPPQQLIVDLLDRHAEQVRTVFILGDLFDFWYGYRTVVFRQFLPLLFRLRRLVDERIDVHYLAGNHDFCPGPAFREQLGVLTYDGALEVELGGQRLYLAHGDLINPRDLGYRLLHALVRSRPMDWLIRLVPPDLGWRLAMLASRGSRRYSSRIRWKRPEIFHGYARRLFDLGFDGVMMGHSHFPELTYIEHGGRKRLVANTGDWIRSYTSILYRPGKGFLLEHHAP